MSIFEGMQAFLILKYTLKDFTNLIRSSKYERPHKHEDQKNPRFNRFSPIVFGVLRCDKDSTPHTNRFASIFFFFFFYIDQKVNNIAI